ncbi:alcohol dehydrogenase [Aspergillus avenaceus]|uniref:Alcohol dehydrogenase n=1 Tax=Aspergillus avenaceus TaxID=36643 RepID=A0A5N6TQ00_ASPAV|nr:alcohol dehydrogenase [Aspergillus avenaceus]
MKAVIYQGPHEFTVEERPKPCILEPTDAIVKVTHTTICGTDLHILQGDIASTPGCILGHEGVGVIDSVGIGVTNLQPGERVVIPAINGCGRCVYCRRGMASQCEVTGFAFGMVLDGMQAEYVRVPHAMFSLYVLPEEIDPGVGVLLSDVLPTAYEGSILNGGVGMGSSVVILGAGPVALAVLLLLKKLAGPSQVVVVGRGQSRLGVAKMLGADHVLTCLDGDAQVVKSAKALTGNRGFDVVIEAVGLTEVLETSQALVAAGGTIALLGAHMYKCDLHLESLWLRNITLKTLLVNTSSVPDLLRVVKAGKIHPEVLISHEYSFQDIEAAYEAFKTASKHGMLKVLITV